jgi:selenoprotein W-related protein
LPGARREQEIGGIGKVAFLQRGDMAQQYHGGKDTMDNYVEISYCTQCRWLLRAAWMAQELLTTFDQEIVELRLRPGTGGIFEVRANGELVWSRKEMGGFPDIKELKQLVRDRIAPGRDLGHSDRKTPEAGS